MNKHYICSALGQAAPNIAAIAKGQAAIANIINVIEANSSSSGVLMSGLKLPRLAGEIEFRNVCFAYPSQRELLFEGLSFSIPAEKSFAIVGMSGSGKSTIISMLLRFYDPCAGISYFPPFLLMFYKEGKPICIL